MTLSLRPSLRAMSSTSTSMGILFGTLIVANACLQSRTYLANLNSSTPSPPPPPNSKLAKPLTLTHSSISALLSTSSSFGAILLLCYTSENHPPFPHSDKVYDRDLFMFLTLLLFLVSYFTLKPNKPLSKAQPNTPDSTILNRDQTEEWKGWMQFCFLLYHYYHAEETYNAIRIMITCYVWMTGFGNFSFFYLKRDFSLTRVIQMLWRLNFLVIFLCLSLNNTYILYYICPLHTFFFFMVYLAMYVFESMNHKKYQLRFKLLGLAFVIFLTWDLKTPIFEVLHFYLPVTPTVGATGGAMWEWYFRTTLDHWSTFIGMIFAANYPITALWMKKVEALPASKEWLIKSAVGIPLFGAFFWWYTNPFQNGKLEYNTTNAYFGFIPLIAYIFFRNIHPKMRSYSLDLLHQIGKTTLETYLLQHHIWLTSNAKSLLTLVPGWPKCNMIVVTTVYFLVSRKVYSQTMYLRGMLLPDDLKVCLKSLGAIAAALFFAGFLGAFVASSNAGGVASITFISLGLGFLVDHMIHSELAKREALGETTENTKVEGGHAHRLLVVGVAVVSALVASVYLHTSAVALQPLPFSCKNQVAAGKWVVVDECAESSRAAAYHDSNVASFTSCNSVDTWGWDVQSPMSTCRFTRRTQKDLTRTLSGGRRIVFVGDSSVRKTFYGLSRAMGADAQDSNDPSLKHADIEIEVGTTKLQFIWAPLAADMEKKFEEGGVGAVVDYVVAGGGLWDCLHEHEKFDAYKATLGKINSRLNEYKLQGVGVAWLAPSTIWDAGLTDESKKALMQEKDVVGYRTTQSELLDSMADFDVYLDASKITAGKEALTVDGVHYPDKFYDVMVQILAQSFDWGLKNRELDEAIFKSNEIGKMANPGLGLAMLLVCAIGLFTFDGYLGFAWLGSAVAGGPSPRSLWEEAFGELHKGLGLEVVAEREDKKAESQMEEGLEMEMLEGEGGDLDDLDDLLMEEQEGVGERKKLLN